jgi:glyoxylase-like metal-dependent hydrolase (beta-lactamase superfamily II)
MLIGEILGCTSLRSANRRLTHVSAPFIILMATLCNTAAAGAQELPVRSIQITNVRGDLYRVDDGGQTSVFLVTPDGIVLGDPLSVTTARSLAAELAKRFPQQPVKYVVHSRHDFERAGGAWIFNHTARVVAHERFNQLLTQARASLPSSLSTLDRNANAILERSEIESSPLAATLAPEDRNRDGNLTPGEIWSTVGAADLKYEGRYTITLGGRRVELLHPGDAFGSDLTLVYFPDDRVLFAVDYAPLNSVPASFAPSTPRGALASLQRLDRLDFEMIITGRGQVGSRADLETVRNYVQDLLSSVRAGFKAGRTVDELQNGVVLSKYAALANYPSRHASNVAEVYRTLQLITTNAYGAAQVAYRERGECQEVTCVGIGGSAISGLGGMSIASGWFAGGVEVSRGGHATGMGYNRSTQQKATLVSFLARYRWKHNSAITAAVLGGPTLILTSTKSVYYPSINFVPPTQFTSTETKLGQTFGVELDMSLGAGIRLVFPTRVTHIPAEMSRIPAQIVPENPIAGTWHIQTGAGVLLPLFRQVR